MPAATTTRNHDLFLTIIEAADELRISERSLRSLIQAGEVQACRLGKRIVRIPRAEIERLATVGCSGFRSAPDTDRETSGKTV